MFDTVESTSLAVAAVAGLLLGAFYFGGLWGTVRRMPRALRPLNLYFGSLVIRLAVVLAAFYGVLTHFSWPHSLATLAGFIMARLAITVVIGQVPSLEATQQETI